ncbi:MAG: PAS domain S-box protein, partial [Flavobacteriales bacterium]|nr:PAS domain S-box protein [Flavobacteriales bacterium]
EKLVKDIHNTQLRKGMLVTDITPLENLIQFKVETERAFSGRTVVVEKHFRINEKDHWFERHINPVRDENGKIERITLWSLDITDRKEAEENLKENESKFRKLAALLPVGIYQVDADRKITYSNQSLQLITGANSSSLNDGSWIDRVHPDDIEKAKLKWNSTQNNKEGLSVEYRILKKNDEIVHVLEQAQPLFNHLGERSGWLGIIVDITEQKQTQKLLLGKKIAENSLRFRSEFLASMSHEIRTPLNGIMGLSEVLLDTDLSADQLSKINNILGASKDLRSIVNEVLDLSQLEAGKIILQKESFNLSELLEPIAERHQPEAREKGLELIFEKPEDNRTLFTDRRRMTQVLSNLVRNAIKFTASGSVTVSTEMKNQQLRLRVTDTGPGIPSKDRKKLFQDFSQLDHTTAQSLEGTGLGLSISKKLMQLLGGSIGVESSFGKGSMFWIEIKITEEAKNNAEIGSGKHKSHAEKNLSGTSVLLVEDNLINQQAFKLMLKKMGCKVDVRSNGKQAVDNFTQDKYDIVFMDIQMPEMDGLQATSEIKKRFEDVPPIVGLSGNILQRDEDGNLKSDMDDLLLKPVVSNDIERMIRKWVA